MYFLSESGLISNNKKKKYIQYFQTGEEKILCLQYPMANTE